MIKSLSLLFLLVLPLLASSQTLRGKITDKTNGQPLAGAYIILINSSQELNATTDSLGRFRLEALPPGRYLARISYLGYSAWQAEELLMQRSKETVLVVELEPMVSTLEEVEVKPDLSLAPAFALGAHGFTIEQTQRFAAAYYDPARLANSFPGVVTTDDQANNLSIRGHSPAGLLWRLDGVNIVNPNHLANAGTFSDRAAPTGGGVSILSAQLLSDSRLLTGNFQPAFANTTAGVMDMRLRRGNNQKREHTLQASLLGIDLATEGPLSKKKEGAYLVNYRYSTVGLLSAAGVNFGNEEITYQDLSYNVSLPAEGAGEFTIFGLGGISRNTFTNPDREEWETEKDQHNINYRSEMIAVGGTHELRFGGKWRLSSAVAFSSLQNHRTDYLNPVNLPASPLLANERQKEHLTSFRTQLSYPVTARLTAEAGLVADYHQHAFRNRINDFFSFKPELEFFLLQPYLNTVYQVSPKFTWQAGLQLLNATHTNQQVVNPQTSIRYQLAPAHAVVLSAGRYSQVPPAALVLWQQEFRPEVRQRLEFIKSGQFALGYHGSLYKAWPLKVEAYYQKLSQVPVAAYSQNTYSAINFLNEPAQEPLKSTGTGRNYGVEVKLEKPLRRNYYLLLSGTAYRSVYTAADNIERSSRFDGRFATSLTAGKEWHWLTASEKHREAGLHLRTTYRGGLRDMPIHLDLSQSLFQTIYDQSQGYAVQLPNYFRLDLRLSLRTNRSRSTRLWYLDIQNATSYQNVAYQYYDSFQQKILTRYQLGIIPVLGYRVEF